MVKLKEITEGGDSKPHEVRVFEAIFTSSQTEVMLSDLKEKFYKELSKIKESLYGELTKKRYFVARPDKVRNIYYGIGVVVIIASFFLAPGGGAKIASIVSGVLIVIFGRYMPKKTRKGAMANEKIMGFRDFIERAEEDRIKRLATEDPTLFDRTLPFAIVFGLEDRWADAFTGLYTQPPSWYHSPRYIHTFTPRVFVSDLGRSLSTMNKTFESKPKSSGGGSSGLGGGGFSGGGFGGGGGGSW